MIVRSVLQKTSLSIPSQPYLVDAEGYRSLFSVPSILALEQTVSRSMNQPLIPTQCKAPRDPQNAVLLLTNDPCSSDHEMPRQCQKSLKTGRAWRGFWPLPPAHGSLDAKCRPSRWSSEWGGWDGVTRGRFSVRDDEVLRNKLKQRAVGGTLTSLPPLLPPSAQVFGLHYSNIISQIQNKDRSGTIVSVLELLIIVGNKYRDETTQ